MKREDTGYSREMRSRTIGNPDEMKGDTNRSPVSVSSCTPGHQMARRETHVVADLDFGVADGETHRCEDARVRWDGVGGRGSPLWPGSNGEW